MHMVRHDHKSRADSLMLFQTTSELSNDNPFGLIMLKQFSTLETRESDEVDVLFVVVHSSVDHRALLTDIVTA